MKNIRLAMVIACTLLGTAVVNAQSLYDAARLMGNDLNGTARFIGMGGAMGALGGDISTMGTNPAGIGIYRSSDERCPSWKVRGRQAVRQVMQAVWKNRLSKKDRRSMKCRTS